MKKVLVKWSDNWADEMDVEGFVILEKEEWESTKKRILSIKEEFTMYIGTNEEIEYANGKDFLTNIEVKSLSPDEEKIINKFFGDSGGFYNFLDVYGNDEEDEDEDEEITPTIIPFTTGEKF